MTARSNGIIAIDGPAGSGKSTAAQGLAMRLGYTHLNSGAIYRCITCATMDHVFPLDEGERIAEMASGLKIEFLRETDGRSRVIMNGLDLSFRITKTEVERKTPHVARNPEVRRVVDELLRGMVGDGGIVCDGRDIGTTVFPHAHAKFYLVADLEVRSQRYGKRPEMIADRDRQDRERSASPLRKAADAYELDTTRLSKEDVLNILYDKALPHLPR